LPLGLFKCASRFRKDGNTLVIDGGDILQGSPLGAFCHDTPPPRPSGRFRTRSALSAR